jgi:signal recognition particle receptor subunit beta
VDSVSSMTSDEDTVQINQKKVNLIDVPGHERLRSRLWRDFLPIARGIVFVVDSVELSSNLRPISE